MCLFNKKSNKKQIEAAKRANTIDKSEEVTVEHNGKTLILESKPQICPHCGKKVGFRFITKINGQTTRNSNEIINLVVFQCVECSEITIGRYFSNGNRLYINSCFSETPFYPERDFQEETFDDIIKAMFPAFVKIYNQAKKAQHYDCIDIAGAGYRKAAEFLIRDFAIYKQPDKKESIVNTSAAKNVVKNFLNEYAYINKAAEASLELGNDETHYTKIYQNRDIDDLKRFISITCRAMVADIELERFEKEHLEYKAREGRVPVKEMDLK